MKGLGCWLALLVAAPFILGSVGQGADLQEVGEYGDPARLSFQGLKTFTEASLKRSLGSNLDYQLAKHPAAFLDDFLTALRVMLEAGFRHAGFPQPRVEPRLDREAGKVVVSVVEGPRYDCGDIKALGLQKIPIADFIQRLAKRLRGTNNQDKADLKLATVPGPNRVVAINTGRQDNAEALLGAWAPGQPAPFDSATLRSFSNCVANLFADFGCFFPVFQLSVKPGPGKAAADLVVDVTKEGPPAFLGDVEVSGSKLNARSEVLKYLRLEPGQKITREFLAEREQLLWDSGRFAQYQLTPAPPDRSGRMKLSIQLTDFPDAPLLAKELTDVEKGLLQLHHWLTDWPNRGEDLILTSTLQGLAAGSTHQLELVFSPMGRVLVAFKEFKESPQQSRAGQWLGAGVIASNAVSLYAPSQQRKLVMSWPVQELRSFFNLVPEPDPKAGHSIGLTMGAGFSTTQSGVPFHIDMKLAPAAFLHLAHPKEGAWAIQNGELVLSRKDSAVRINAQTGRLVQFEAFEPKSSLPFASLQKMTVAFAANAFANESREIAQATANHPNAFNEQKPLSSSLAYLTGQLFQVPKLSELLFKKATPAQLTSAAKAVERLLSESMLAPLKPALTPIELILLPSEAETQLASTNTALAASCGVVLNFGETVLPHSGWPLTLLRETCFVLAGRGRYTRAELNRLYFSPQTGPMGFLATAQLLGKVDAEAVRNFASRGLQRLTAADFARDWRPFLEGDSPVSQCLRNLAANFSRLDQKEVEALAALLSDSAGAFLRQSAQALRQANGRPIATVLAPAFDEYWNHSLRAQVEEALLLTVSPGSVVHQEQRVPNPGRPAVPTAVQTTLAAAQKDFEAGRYTEAEKKYEQLLQADGNNVDLLGNLATVQLRANRLPEAEATLQRALALKPNDAFNLSLRGILRVQQKNFDAALADLSRSADLDPNNSQTQNFLGITLEQKGPSQAAEAAFLAALRLNPNYAEAHFNLAVHYAYKTPSDLGLARSHYQKAIELGHHKNPELEKRLSLAPAEKPNKLTI